MDARVGRTRDTLIGVLVNPEIRPSIIIQDVIGDASAVSQYNPTNFLSFRKLHYA